jgi:hypothetical protein
MAAGFGVNVAPPRAADRATPASLAARRSGRAAGETLASLDVAFRPAAASSRRHITHAPPGRKAAHMGKRVELTLPTVRA